MKDILWTHPKVTKKGKIRVTHQYRGILLITKDFDDINQAYEWARCSRAIFFASPIPRQIDQLKENIGVILDPKYKELY